MRIGRVGLKGDWFGGCQGNSRKHFAWIYASCSCCNPVVAGPSYGLRVIFCSLTLGLCVVVGMRGGVHTGTDTGTDTSDLPIVRWWQYMMFIV